MPGSLPLPGETSAAADPETPPQPGLPVPTRYFKSSEVDQRAEPLAMATLIYPEAAYMRRLPGVVSLRVFVNEGGGIDAIDVVDAEPQGVFEQAAVDAVLNTRFAPARRFGRPVKNVKTLEVRFDPWQDRPASPGGASSP